jgi:hypothetical protein
MKEDDALVDGTLEVGALGAGFDTYTLAFKDELDAYVVGAGEGEVDPKPPP